jgi:hypothetical protein
MAVGKPNPGGETEENQVLKIFKGEELVAEGEADEYLGDVFPFDGLKRECLEDLVTDAENVTAQLPESFWESIGGRPESLSLSLADLGPRGRAVRHEEFEMIADSDNPDFEFSVAVRKAIKAVLGVIKVSDTEKSEWVATLRPWREKAKNRVPQRRSDGNPPKYQLGK